ncbi:recombinase family protein [Caulobacter sp. CCH5-E12]|uniref:recombinase family protein n=1 Tax=Caulobacter sp. CCH5-E12 TaxID=1768770 RepID=UPI000A830675|nr:recombinase family protein [Caulobacter sp. CCH5-E12]
MARKARTNTNVPAVTRAALYLRVSTGRQAENDLSIPDQRRQLSAYCETKGWSVESEFVEPGNTATDDRRPQFQTMIDAALSKPPPFTVILVHSFSRFFRDQFMFEFYARKLARNGVRIVSITQELGDDPMSIMMRQIMNLFDEYQSRENAKHTLRAMKENARQGFWNGARPPIGYRIVAAEQRGAKIKTKLEIDPVQADKIRLIYRLALIGSDNTGPMGVKAIAAHLNERNVTTRDGGRWGVSGVHYVLTAPTYIGEHHFNKRVAKTGEFKADDEHVVLAVPPIVSHETFDAVQRSMALRRPTTARSQAYRGPTLLGGIIFCGNCGGAMTLRTGRGNGGQYR